MNMTIDGIDFGELWIWPDEYDWSPVVQATEHTVTGALVVEEDTRTAGRPITLRGNWLTRSQVESLKTLRDAGGAHTLNYRGASTTVYWRHADTAVEARELFSGSSVPSTQTLYECTLRFIEG
ncbi:MAG: hypothetical protein OQL08_09185 [Gammaproteobacteria bacterium]|nr:hypothetical protein [Gammaproteobacteria bacterium]